MKKFSLDVKDIRNNQKLETASIKLDDLKDTGLGIVSYGIAKGDVINFPESRDEVSVFSQQVRAGSTAKQYLVGVTRNGKESFLSIGTLRRTDNKMNGTCEFTDKMFKDYENDMQRVEALVGKTITCNETVECEFNAFTPEGQLIDGETTKRTCPVIEFVD